MNEKPITATETAIALQGDITCADVYSPELLAEMEAQRQQDIHDGICCHFDPKTMKYLGTTYKNRPESK